MSFLRRALLYLTRKKTKSLLLFLILLVIATLALSGAAIKGAAETAQLNVRQALGGIFTLQQNTSDPSKWVSTDVAGYGSTAYYGGEPLTVELAEYIQSNVKGITGYNATYTNYTVPLKETGDILELLDSDEDGSGTSALLAGYGDLASTIATYASTNTAYDSYFSGGYLELTAGRHLTSADKNAALISQELAELNNLEIGDPITLRMSEYKAALLGYDAAETCVTVEIIGLFQSTSKSTASLSNWSMDNSIFTTLEVVRTARPDMGDESYEKIAFYVNDPAQLDSIVAQVESLPNLDPSDFVISMDSSSTDAVMEPLNNLNQLVSILIILALAVGGVIVYLVLSTRVKERTHESGILLSLGLSKWNIIAQHLAEGLLLGALAFTCSIFISGFVAQGVGSQLLNYTILNSQQEETIVSDSSMDGVSLFTSDSYAPQFQGTNSLTQIQVSISPSVAAALYGVGFLIICAAILAAALPVFKMKPRDILTKLS